MTDAGCISGGGGGEIERFCRDLLLLDKEGGGGKYQHLQKIITEYDAQLSYSIEIHIFTVDNFDTVFRGICRRLFETRPASTTYVLALLSFAVHIDKRLKDISWYKTDMTISVLTRVLVHINFNPARLHANHQSFCTLL